MTSNKEYFRPAPNQPAVTEMLDNHFTGRLFRIGNPATNAVWGDIGTFNDTYDELLQQEACGNAGINTDIIEVATDGTPLKKALVA